MHMIFYWFTISWNVFQSWKTLYSCLTLVAAEEKCHATSNWFQGSSVQMKDVMKEKHSCVTQFVSLPSLPQLDTFSYNYTHRPFYRASGICYTHFMFRNQMIPVCRKLTLLISFFFYYEIFFYFLPLSKWWDVHNGLETLWG